MMNQLPNPKQDEAQKGAWLSIGAYFVLSLVKLWIGSVSHSQAVFADGLNNVSDILLSIAILIGLKVSSQPADHNHPYGHWKAETIATLVAAILMVLVAIEVWIQAIQALIQPKPTQISPVALYVSLGSAVVMFIVSSVNMRLSRKTNSIALQAAAHDNRSDAYVSIGAAVGIVGSYGGFGWLDPVAAFLVGILIVKTGWEVGAPAIHMLMDGFDQEKLQGIEEKVLQISGITQVKEIRARNHGVYVYVDMTITVDPYLSVIESHLLTEEIENGLKGYLNIVSVHVHVEPSLQADKLLP
ncbi:cation diffusion facilitator family transporter [Hazenella coriacea]|nr:cation diffusion facilitator family transporter [Hazenella coriacea]